MRAFELLTPSARTVPPEVRTGWLSDLAGDAVVLHAMRGFRPMILGLVALFAGQAV